MRGERWLSIEERMYAVVEGCAGEVTQEDSLCVRPWFQSLDGVEQGVVAVAVEAAGQGRYVNKKVGFDHHDAGHHRHRLIFCFHVAVEQVQLHALSEQFSEITQVYAFFAVAVVYADGFAVARLYPDGLLVPMDNDAADIFMVDAQSLSVGSSVMGQQSRQFAWHICSEHRCHQHSQCAQVVEQFFLGKHFPLVRVPSHGLHVVLVGSLDTMLAAHIVYLCKQVAEATSRSARTLGTRQHQHLVHRSINILRQFPSRRLSAQFKQFACFQVSHASLLLCTISVTSLIIPRTPARVPSA